MHRPAARLLLLSFTAVAVMSVLPERGARVAAGVDSRRCFDIAGEWRLFLPAGFEKRVAFEKIEGERYRLTPGKLTFGGIYAVRGDRAVLVEPNDPSHGGFEWQIRSPYMISLIEQSENTGAEYTGATFFRSADIRPKGE